MSANPSIASNMGELTVSNHLLGDRGALDAAWERDGYWFFRGVLDKDAVARFRSVYTDVLADLGVVTRDDPQARYTGVSLENFPFRMDPLVERQPWKAFVSEPTIHDFFTYLLGDEPFWVPTVEYRATPPAQDRDRPRFDFIHEDGAYNRGIPFRICWVPLGEIDEDVGGLALGEGLHRGPSLYPVDDDGQMKPIPLDAIPAERWRRASYRPGDVLLMDIRTPHSGLSNLSERFRLSIDMRVMTASDKVPMVGRVMEIASDHVTVRDESREVSFALDETTYVRGLDGKKIDLDDIPVRFAVGQEVIVSGENGLATVLRPPH